MTKNLKKKITALGSTRIWKFDNDKNEDAKKYKLLVLTTLVTIKHLEVMPNQGAVIYVKPQSLAY